MPPRPERGHLVVLALIVAVGAWWRLAWVGHAIAPDELANLPHASAWDIFSSSESGVNPPLLRLVFNVPFEEPEALWAGRWFSWVCGVALMPAVFLLGWLASGNVWVGLVAAAWVAVHPYSIRMSGRFRAYAPFALTLALHLVTLMRWRLAVDAEAKRRWLRWSTAMACLLPWWHYQAVPLLLLMGAAMVGDRSWRSALRGYVIAALCVSPMAWFVWAKTGSRVVHRGALWDLGVRLVSLGQPPAAWQMRVLFPGTLIPGGSALPYGITALCFGAGLLAALVLMARRRLSPEERLLLYACGGVLVGSLALSWVQLVRNPTTTMVIVGMAPLLASVFLRQHWLARLAWTPVVVGLVMGSWVENQHLHDGRAERVQRDVLLRIDAFDEVRGDAPVFIWPSFGLTAAYYHHLGHTLRHAHRGGPKPDIVIDGRRVEAMRRWQPQAEGLYVAVEPLEDDVTVPAHCEVLEDGALYAFWACGRPDPQEPSPVD